jgi:superfamily II DNA or RNA helicase
MGMQDSRISYNNSFRELAIKKSYDSDSDNILEDFYIPLLSRAISYRRLSGFFSSSSLAVAAKGISKLILNGGKYQLVTGAKFREADIQAIKDAYETPEKIIEMRMHQDLETIEDEFVRDHVRALGWMVKNGKLEIKIAIICDEDGFPLSEELMEKQGVFHLKVGILEDREGNKISFSGSENETATGWQDNIEEFKVFRSWVDDEKEYLEADCQKFLRFWSGESKRAKVIDIPEAIKHRLIEIAPDNIEALDLDKWLRRSRRVKRKIELRDYQKEAVDSWLKNGKKGIFEMATGTGKTFAALGCVEAIINRQRLVIVVSCPYVHLIEQWKREIEKFGIYSDIVIADGSHKGWRDELSDKLYDIENNIINNLIVLTTHDTLASEDFIAIINGSSAVFFLIVDEVHGIGAPVRKTALIEKYDFRLGLSATPKRWFDEEGTEKIYEYFGDVVFSFPLEKAIGRFLTEFEYEPHFVELTEDEMIKYEEQTAKIAKTYYSTKDEKERSEAFSLLCIKRQDIIKNAINKYQVLNEILDANLGIKYCLIYCSPQQIDIVQDILNRKGIIQHKFTQSEGTRVEDKYGGMSERQFLLKRLAEGTYQALVAIRCLDEGVDIPPARFAILLSSSGNPREYVQRMGRLLRKFPGKDKAVIHDVIVMPRLHDLRNRESLDLERKIISKELKRYREIAYLALNAVSCMKKIESIEHKYGVIE